MRLPKWSHVDGTVQLNSGIEIAVNLVFLSFFCTLYLFTHKLTILCSVQSFVLSETQGVSTDVNLFDYQVYFILAHHKVTLSHCLKLHST